MHGRGRRRARRLRRPHRGRARVALAPFVFVVALAVYVAGLQAEPYWLDSSELAAAAWQLGVAHPPGHPLAALLGRACAMLPIGPVAFKVGLASAICAALAAAVTASLAARVTARVRAQLAAERAPRTEALLGAAAGLAYGLSYAAALQAVRPEVYALSSLLVLLTVSEVERWDATADRRRLYLAALCAGLALSNHHLLALAAVAPALVFVVARRALRPVAPALALVSVAGTLGLSLFAYLPLRAAAHPLVSWGAPWTLDRLAWTVSARAFQKAVERGEAGDALAVGLELALQLHVVGALLALGGAYVLLRVPATRRLGLLLGAAALFDAALPAIVGFDPGNPDAYGYLSAAVALLAVCAIALPAALSTRLVPPGRVAFSGAFLVAALAAGALTAPRTGLAAHRDVRETVGGWLEAQPPRALAVTSYFQTVFALFYLRGVEGARPDVDLVHRHFLAYPGYRDELVLARPELAPLLGARDVDTAALARSGRPLAVEYDLDLPAALVAVSREMPIPAGAETRADLQSRRFFAWQAYLAARRACEDRAAFVAALKTARALLGSAPELDALEAQCLRSPRAR